MQRQQCGRELQEVSAHIPDLMPDARPTRKQETAGAVIPGSILTDAEIEASEPG